MALDQTRFRNLFSQYPISKFVCFESETERNPRMQFFVRNPREGHTKLIRNIPVTTDKLIYEIVINFDIIVQYDYMCVWVINVASFYDRLLTLELFRECTFLFFILCYNVFLKLYRIKYNKAKIDNHTNYKYLFLA